MSWRIHDRLQATFEKPASVSTSAYYSIDDHLVSIGFSKDEANVLDGIASGYGTPAQDVNFICTVGFLLLEVALAISLVRAFATKLVLLVLGFCMLVAIIVGVIMSIMSTEDVEIGAAFVFFVVYLSSVVVTLRGILQRLSSRWTRASMITMIVGMPLTGIFFLILYGLPLTNYNMRTGFYFGSGATLIIWPMLQRGLNWFHSLPR